MLRGSNSMLRDSRRAAVCQSLPPGQEHAQFRWTPRRSHSNGSTAAAPLRSPGWAGPMKPPGLWREGTRAGNYRDLFSPTWRMPRSRAATAPRMVQNPAGTRTVVDQTVQADGRLKSRDRILKPAPAIAATPNATVIEGSSGNRRRPSSRTASACSKSSRSSSAWPRS